MLAALKSLTLPRLAHAIVGSTLFGLSSTLPARAEEVITPAIQEDRSIVVAVDAAPGQGATVGTRTDADDLPPPLATPDGLFLDEALQQDDHAAVVNGIRARQRVVAR